VSRYLVAIPALHCDLVTATCRATGTDCGRRHLAYYRVYCNYNRMMNDMYTIQNSVNTAVIGVTSGLAYITQQEAPL